MVVVGHQLLEVVKVSTVLLQSSGGRGKKEWKKRKGEKTRGRNMKEIEKGKENDKWNVVLTAGEQREEERKGRKRGKIWLVIELVNTTNGIVLVTYRKC